MLFSFFLGFAFCGLPIGTSCNKDNREFVCGDYLICSEKHNFTCQYCNSDAECHENEIHFYCRFNSKWDNYTCHYEPLIHKWDKKLIIGMVCTFFAGVFVSGAGIGGGGLFVPIMMLIVGFPGEYCIPTSKALIFGGSLAVTLFNLNKKHPYYDRPLINYNVASIIEPISWLGTILGVIFNSVIPDWLLYLIQFILLAYTAWATFKKGLKDMRKAKELGYEGPLTPGPYESPDGKAFSVWILVLLFIIWGIFLAISFLRGGDGADSIIGVEFCSWQYWLLTFGPFPIYALINVWMIMIARKYPVVGPKADLGFKSVGLLMLSGFIAGIAAGFLGIGGGMIKGPMMLALDIEGEEMAATSSFMILLTSSATSFQYIAEGIMPFAEFGIYTATGFVSFLVGIIFLRWLVKKMGNRSLFLFFLAAIIAISAVLMSVVGVIKVIRGIKAHISMGFRSFCLSA
ncbi:hypothetical protein TRFO_07265 [Tritrichomonas foetus]|uniref:Major facilitator superfamily (MFS) profile domain-containing protein n=1 Tax=Tritrichomonas foetus TaxID=1144522 RepID=A0A1J4JTL0_9EUKA|nr:hypothetical protein TRFO_07265 [Tritrichomonas foetus]|eukprot:OHT02082.1 hypothetical protein TRFO_07265 [Tritrichomonas foetus]